MCSSSSPGLRVRIAKEDDWPTLQALWRRHHHLLESVSSTTHALVVGPFAWLAMVGAGLLAMSSRSRSPWILFKIIGIYACFVVAQHFVHWSCAWAILAFDLEWGELKAAAWTGQGRSAKAPVALIAEGCDGEVFGVVCLKFAPAAEGCCRGKGRSRLKKRTASLWQATVDPQYRNRGVASALLKGAEQWACAKGASILEVLTLSTQAKAVCHNAGFTLWNTRFGRLTLIPAIFSKTLAPA